MSTLYNISEDLLLLFDELEENEGEPTESQLERLNISEGELKQKAVAYYSVIQDSKATIEVIDAEIKRLQAKKKKTNTLIDNLNGRLLGAVNLFGGFEAGLLTFGTRKSKSVTIEDENAIPCEYKIIKKVESIDKKLISTHLKEGHKINGVRLSENLNLKIK